MSGKLLHLVYWIIIAILMWKVVRQEENIEGLMGQFKEEQSKKKSEVMSGHEEGLANELKESALIASSMRDMAI